MNCHKKRFPANAELLTAEQVQLIHEASLEILENVGLKVNNKKARDLFKKNGCHIDSETLIVKFPRTVIKEFMSIVPTEFTFHGRDPKYDRVLPQDGPIFATASSATSVIDLETGRLRPSTSEDIARIGHLINEMPGIDIYTCAVTATDAPPEQRNLARFYPALKNCLKPVRASGVNTVEEAEKILTLGALVAGTEEAFMERPFIMFHNCPIIAPLKMDYDSTEMLIYFTERKIPTYATIVPNAGLTSPMSLSGTLAQANAEFLAAAVLMQMVRPGAPVLYSTLPTVADLRTGAYAAGAIETGILHMGCAQMARYYNVPCSGYIGQTNSKLPDAQAGLERTMSSMAGLLAGMDMMHIGGLLDGLMTFDYGMFMIDDEIGQMLKRIKRGYEFSSDELEASINVLSAVGPGGTFLETEHTYARMKSVPFIPAIADRSTRVEWEEKGAMDAASRSLQKVRDILSRDNPAVFSPEIDARIKAKFPGLVAGDSLPPKSWQEKSCS